MSKKVCNICGENKLVSEFHKDKSKKDGYRGKCKSCQSEYIKEYYKDNMVELKTKNKIWRVNNHESIVERNKIWKNENLVRYKEIQKDSFNRNKEPRLEYRRNYQKERKKNDPVFKLRCYLSRTFSDVLRENKFTKKSKTTDILGCSFEEFKEHIESQWEDWMTWDNYGNPEDGIIEPNKTWDLDHIMPIASAVTEKDIIRLNHYTNLQPLCSYINRMVKRDSFN